MQVVSGPHGFDDDIGEHPIIEPLDLDVIAQRGQIAVQRPELAGRPIVIRRLRWRRLLLERGGGC